MPSICFLNFQTVLDERTVVLNKKTSFFLIYIHFLCLCWNYLRLMITLRLNSSFSSFSIKKCICLIICVSCLEPQINVSAVCELLNNWIVYTVTTTICNESCPNSHQTWTLGLTDFIITQTVAGDTYIPSDDLVVS